MSVLDVSAEPVDREESRTKRLKSLTHKAHDRLDKRIMSAQPFANRDLYAVFLAVQHRFHVDVDRLYSNPALAALLPDLDGRRRLSLIEQDLTDLGFSVPEIKDAPLVDAETDMATAFGWLYVAEGSNLGAAFLLKEAAKLDLNEGFGARHLAGHPQGRGLHWRTFTEALDSIPLTEGDEERVTEGAINAFQRVHALVEELYFQD